MVSVVWSAVCVVVAVLSLPILSLTLSHSLSLSLSLSLTLSHSLSLTLTLTDTHYSTLPLFLSFSLSLFLLDAERTAPNGVTSKHHSTAKRKTVAIYAIMTTDQSQKNCGLLSVNQLQKTDTTALL